MRNEQALKRLGKTKEHLITIKKKTAEMSGKHGEERMPGKI